MSLFASAPFSFILFGASGNLAKLKIYPALYILALKERLPEDYAIIGFARSKMDNASFRQLVEDSIRDDVGEVNEAVLKAFLTHVHYHQGQYDKQEDFESLRKNLEQLEQGWQDSVRLSYLSIPPEVFTSVLHNLCKSKVRGGGPAFRCIVEKPVGQDLASFESIKHILTECFSEEEIYLLDHYLGKEAVRNVYYLRYANPILERILKNTLIHHVEITASETLGIQGRAGYFDTAGTLRDYFQSHMLLMAALLTMRTQTDEAAFRSSRGNALSQFYIPPATNLGDIIIQGQYAEGDKDGARMMAYIEEEGVPDTSRNNTYIALKLMTRMSKWEGVPFYVRSGKRLSKRETRISILFQASTNPGEGSTPNRLDIILQGEAGMRLHLQTRMGGLEPRYRPLIMEDPLVCIGDCLPEHGQLLLEAIHGRSQWYMTFDEVRDAWNLIDPLQAYLDDKKTPLHLYPSGSNGPKEADEWMKKQGAVWF